MGSSLTDLADRLDKLRDAASGTPWSSNPWTPEESSLLFDARGARIGIADGWDDINRDGANADLIVHLANHAAILADALRLLKDFADGAKWCHESPSDQTFLWGDALKDYTALAARVRSEP